MDSKYFLLYKTTGKNIADYSGKAIRISEVIPKTFDEVYIGIKKQPKKIRRITTFRDDNGDIIEKAFDYSDGILRNRVYINRELDISKDETVNSTIIKDYFIRKKMIPYYEDLLEKYKELHPLKNILWNLTDIITNHVSTDKKNGEKILSQVKITDIQKPTKQKHIFTEFPHSSNKKKKSLSFTVNGLTNKVIPNSLINNGTKIPKKDSFLAERALPIYDSKEIFANKFIKERKLNKAEVFVEPDYYPKNKTENLYAADFDPGNGSINFNRFFKPYSKAETVRIARHEVEHGWQYYLRSRFMEPSTEWESFINETFGEIKNPKLWKEAKKYTKSILNYTSLTEDLTKLGNLEKYLNNYIEKMANKIAKKTVEKYNKEGSVIRNNFKHIPIEYL